MTKRSWGNPHGGSRVAALDPWSFSWGTLAGGAALGVGILIFLLVEHLP